MSIAEQLFDIISDMDPKTQEIAQIVDPFKTVELPAVNLSESDFILKSIEKNDDGSISIEAQGPKSLETTLLSQSDARFTLIQHKGKEDEKITDGWVLRSIDDQAGLVNFIDTTSNGESVRFKLEDLPQRVVKVTKAEERTTGDEDDKMGNMDIDTDVAQTIDHTAEKEKLKYKNSFRIHEVITDPDGRITALTVLSQGGKNPIPVEPEQARIHLEDGDLMVLKGYDSESGGIVLKPSMAPGQTEESPIQTFLNKQQQEQKVTGVTVPVEISKTTIIGARDHALRTITGLDVSDHGSLVINRENGDPLGVNDVIDELYDLRVPYRGESNWRIIGNQIEKDGDKFFTLSNVDKPDETKTITVGEIVKLGLV